MSFIKLPNLPKNNVTDVLVSREISKESEYTLNRYNIETHKTKECHSLYQAVQFHPDMTFNHLGGEFAVAEPSQTEYYKEELRPLNICSGNNIKEKYPYDIAYNVARVGRYIIANISYAEKKIIDFAVKEDLDIIDVKQGYSKCNIAVISENAIITSDFGIKSALGKFPIDVLLVDDNSVLLKDFSHGFFGGATGKIAHDKLAVNGNIFYHKNAKEIIEFTKKHNVEIVSLNNNYIEDIGSILPILEK